MTTQKFWKRVTFGLGPNACWMSPGRPDANGYARICQSYKVLRVHQWIYKTYKGPIPSGFVIRHACDNGMCCNPDHLLAGTPKENSGDMVRRGRCFSSKVKACPRGHPYDEKNTRFGRNRNGNTYRLCARCRQVRFRYRRLKNYLACKQPLDIPPTHTL